MKFTKLSIFAIAVVSCSVGVVVGMTGFKDAYAAKNKTYQVLKAPRFNDVAEMMNQASKDGWEYEGTMGEGAVIMSK